jgi:uncharacterized caspase-like protein
MLFDRLLMGLALMALGLSLLLGPAQAQAPKRVALLIGNAQYAIGPLRNPPNDVRLMSESLKALGFQTEVVLNANQARMKRAVRDFGTQAQGADVALLYYSGHGTQAGGENYLIPVQAQIDKEADYELEAVSANSVMRQIAGARPHTAIVVLDACRDNPMASTTKSGTKGLGRMDAPSGSMIAFATAPNTTASDEGHYARVLAAQLRTPGLELIDVFRNTTAEVRRLSGGRQEPRVSEMSISDRVYLAGPPPSGSNLALAPAIVPSSPAVSDRAFTVALARFHGGSAWAETLADVIADDLARVPRLKVIRLASTGMAGGLGVTPEMRAQAPGADYFVVGELQVLPDGRLELRVRLTGTADLGGRSQVSSVADARLNAHRHADHLHLKIFGKPSAFGHRRAFVTLLNNRYTLMVADSDGEGRQKALESPKAIGLPTWAYDGKRLAYVSWESGTAQLFLQTTATGVRIAASDSATVLSPCRRELRDLEMGTAAFMADDWSGAECRQSLLARLAAEEAASGSGNL